MKKRIMMAMLLCLACTTVWAAQTDTEKTISVGGKSRKYVLYVPDKAQGEASSPTGREVPLVFSLHGAGGSCQHRSPFRTTVADSVGCIVVYPQGEGQVFPIFGDQLIPGWQSTGVANEDLDFFKAIIEEVAKDYSLDRQRIYCCGFSNGGMMTYSNASAAADIFAAYASISGFQLNEFHHRPTGARPVPFLHIHGKKDNFVKYSCMPVIRDNMVTRNGCNPLPKVESVEGRYTCSTYEAGEGGFPYVYYEIDGMGHWDFTDKTPEGNSAQTMWNFMSRYRLDDACDPTLKWRLNIDTEGWVPEEHGWTVDSQRTCFKYGTPKKPDNQDNNVYPSLQFEQGDYTLAFESQGQAGGTMSVKVETLDGSHTVFCKNAAIGERVVIPFSVPQYTECSITLTKTRATDKFTSFVIKAKGCK